MLHFDIKQVRVFFYFVVYVEILDAWGTLVMKLVCCFTFLSFILRVPYIGKQCYLLIGAQALSCVLFSSSG